MKFKNELEKLCFEIAENIFEGAVRVEHNKPLQIESALFPAVAAFEGPPKKEIDVIAAELCDDPKVMLLISCKEFSRRAEPAHVQEWAAVVRTMNEYSAGTLHFGLIISPSGFSSGCEAWATSHNLALIPPLKGRSLIFPRATVFRMLRRALIALRKRLLIQPADLAMAPAFFDFIYSIVAEFEGHEEAALSARYFMFPQGWLSSFGEMYASLAGHVVESIGAWKRGTWIDVSGVGLCRFDGQRVEFGSGLAIDPKGSVSPPCFKNFECQPCPFDFVHSIVVGRRITSAADFGDYLEFGLDSRFNLGLRPDGFHLVSTENPIDQHRL